ncbi:MAG TPA: hypothetical protein VIK33_20270 [Anaerolineae bacterium]
MKPRFTHALVRGAAFEAGGRVFVPEARVTTLAAREATFCEQTTGIAGFLLRRVRPTALIEHTPDGERRYRIWDTTGCALISMALTAILAPLILNALANRLGRGKFTR